MEDYNEIMRSRLEKADKLRESGINPYANDFRVTHTADEINRKLAEVSREALQEDETHYTLAGRIIAVNSFGKSTFIRIKDRSGKIQVYLRKNLIGDEAYEQFKLCDAGDVVGVEGPAFRTQTDELTIKAQLFRPLTKSVRPLPEKWHGLSNKETRFRQRYVDLIVNDDVAQIFRTRARIIQHIRDFLNQRDFLEVETPMMHAIASGAAARPFGTFHNALSMPLFLRIAPELFLKRLVVGGFDRVYEINRNFRNEGLSQRHNPEFTMLEFYQAYATYEDLMDLTEALISGLAEAVCGKTTVEYDGHELNFASPWARLTVKEAIRKYAPNADVALETLDDLTAFAKAINVELPNKPEYGKLLMELFEVVAEPKLVQPTFITQFPLSVSPLSRKNEADPTFVDRFELFIAKIEVANAFSELNDPVDQRARFEDQMQQREAGDDEAMPIDQDYVRALEYGMPPTAGEGIGIDRIVMLLTGQTSIREVILFPLMRPEQ